jgi:hypothetical protein
MKSTATGRAKKAAESKSLIAFRAGERASAKRAYGPPAPKRIKNTPKPGSGPTVGGAIEGISRGIGDAVRGANSAIQGALNASPGLRSKGIDNVMKLPPKRR